jgi:hypothetical protein
LMMICLTTSVGALRSMRRLWMRISNISQVLEPSPQGVLRVEICVALSAHYSYNHFLRPSAPRKNTGAIAFMRLKDVL